MVKSLGLWQQDDQCSSYFHSEVEFLADPPATGATSSRVRDSLLVSGGEALAEVNAIMGAGGESKTDRVVAVAATATAAAAGPGARSEAVEERVDDLDDKVVAEIEAEALAKALVAGRDGGRGTPLSQRGREQKSLAGAPVAEVGTGALLLVHRSSRQVLHGQARCSGLVSKEETGYKEGCRDDRLRLFHLQVDGGLSEGDKLQCFYNKGKSRGQEPEDPSLKSFLRPRDEVPSSEGLIKGVGGGSCHHFLFGVPSPDGGFPVKGCLFPFLVGPR